MEKLPPSFGKRGTYILLFVVFVLVVTGLYKYSASHANAPLDIDAILGNEDDIPPPEAVPVSSEDLASAAKDTAALGGYDVLIADRGNNRIIEVTPDKRIVWEYTFTGLPRNGFGADDAFFTDGGKTISVNLERYHIVELIDFSTKQVLWEYGTPNKAGKGPNQLNSPDDAYKLSNGDVMVADIKNCRVIEIAPDKSIARQYGKTGICSGPDTLGAPNGDTPLPNGHVLISNIISKTVVELDENWKNVFSMKIPLKYPSDPQLTKAGNILLAEYTNPGKIIEITRQGEVVWEYDGENGVRLNFPSLAIELPNGNILSNDDMNHRVIVIDKKTKKIVWQYGVTNKPGRGDGQLSIPDGVDIVRREVPMPSVQAATTSTQVLPLSTQTVGFVTRHSAKYLGTAVRLKGYVLKQENGYVIFSDEPNGSISSFDLPVTGTGIDTMQNKQQYIIEGNFISHGLTASNNNPNHLELTKPPEVAK
ncbi:MAG: Kelch repeat-containing protein [Parcubacteria group bacterium]|nr:Kelch repeat-containing protein [Parcubacteria group bacterium]